MGEFSEHVLFGFLLAATVMYLSDGFISLGYTELLLSMFAVFIGSVLPDIDHKNSYVHRAVKSLVCIVAGLAVSVIAPLQLPERFAAAAASFIGVYVLLSLWKIRHRGFTHSISFGVTATSLAVIGGIYTVSSVAPGLAMGVGLSSHLMMDREFRLS